MTWDRVERLLGEDVLGFLRTQTVGIIGLGSGGSFAAVSLAMSGVGRFILVDDDALEATNIVRHAADRRYLGQTKVEAVADLIRQRNPSAEVKVVVGRIEAHADLFDEMDLVISGVDGEGPKYLINQACLDRGRTAVYAGVYERGEGGDVCVIVPGQGPCYACWAEHLREGLADPGAEPELDYGMIGPEGTLSAEPGLWLHVVRIASSQADMALNELVQGFDVHREMPGNTVVLANTWLEIYEGRTTLPYGAEWLTIPRNPDCLVCGSMYREQDSAQVSLDDLINLGQVSYEQDESESS
ncbi:HesA/MoeB/ThiF family protein [Aggregatilinea lenta]|uniref:HesA/MoeB/ThiF family protein n=1 Tax=Aggregatilinea lenta TaxID=913108 RepID=UPI000E5A7E8D|nr:ThiF family adenylyltransferase [Aggregatilinea lenta]